MKLTFEQTQDDVFDLSKHSFKNNKLLKIYGVILIIIIILNSIDLSPDGKGFNIANFLPSLIALLLVGVITYFIFKYILKKRFQNVGDQQIMVGKREITLTEEGVHVWTPISETNYQWSAITKLEDSPQNYFLYLGKSQAILVSKSAFENQAQIAEFEKLINSKIDL